MGPCETGAPGPHQRPRGGPISDDLRINDRIRASEVRLVGALGEQVGIVPFVDALRMAEEADLDLVEVAPTARPPVCKLMDFGKYKYEAAQKVREARKNQTLTIIKEMKLRPKIDPHDYETKKGHVVRFLKAGDKVKVTIMFRGREQSRPELGYRLLERLANDVADLGVVEIIPRQDGRNMTMVMAPHRTQRAVRAPHPDPAPAVQQAGVPTAPALPTPSAAPPTPPTPSPAVTPSPPRRTQSASVAGPQPPAARPRKAPAATQVPEPSAAAPADTP